MFSLFSTKFRDITIRLRIDDNFHNFAEISINQWSNWLLDCFDEKGVYRRTVWVVWYYLIWPLLSRYFKYFIFITVFNYFILNFILEWYKLSTISHTTISYEYKSARMLYIKIYIKKVNRAFLTASVMNPAYALLS